MKTISNLLKAHLAEETTTLATCWKITRLDGAVHGLTDHDVDITFANQLYRSIAGYTRSAISSDDSYEAGNTDITGFFDNRGVPEGPTKNGLLDNADVEVFVLNYNDSSQGRLLLLTGKIREIQYTATGKYTIELCGLKQQLNQTIGDVVQPECRADLGDSKCKFPLDPRGGNGYRKERSNGKAYSLGEFFLVATGNDCSIVNAGFQNLGFEDDAGWSLSEGAQIVTGSGARSGSDYLQLSGQATASQTIAIGNEFLTQVNQGTLQIRLEEYWGKRQNTGLSNIATLKILARETNSVTEILNASRPVSASWTRSGEHIRTVPAFTSHLTLELSTPTIDVDDVPVIHFDDIIIEFLTGNRDCYNVYEDRIYECTTAGTTASTPPTYSKTLGATTTDGTAVFTARQAWTRHTLVGGSVE